MNRAPTCRGGEALTLALMLAPVLYSRVPVRLPVKACTMATRIQAPIKATTRLPQKPNVASGTNRFMINPPIKAPTSPMIRSPSRPNHLPGIMSPASQPAIRPMTSQAIRPPGCKAAAKTIVASDILTSFLCPQQKRLPIAPGFLQKKVLEENVLSLTLAACK